MVIDMWLTRTAIIELADPAPAAVSRDAFLARNGCTVAVTSVTGANESGQQPDGSTVIWLYDSDAAKVGVAVMLGVGPPEVVAGRLLVPKEPRLRAEKAIEHYADLVAVAHQCRRTVRSSMAGCVAMAPASPTERLALAGVNEWAADDGTVPTARFLPTLSASDLQSTLEDRTDAVALLADALSEPNAADRARELFRLLERAFSKASTPLIAPLTDFLRSHPRHDALAFERDEVAHWLTTLRPETVHRDKRPVLARSADVEPYIGRLETAAYDVVMNKANWRRSDGQRRNGQPMMSAVEPDGRGVVLLDPRATVRFPWRDPFGKYPIDWRARLSLDREWIWASPGQRDGFDRDAVKAVGWDLH